MKGIGISKDRQRRANGGVDTSWLWIIGFVTMPIGIGVFFILVAIALEI